MILKTTPTFFCSCSIWYTRSARKSTPLNMQLGLSLKRCALIWNLVFISHSKNVATHDLSFKERLLYCLGASIQRNVALIFAFLPLVGYRQVHNGGGGAHSLQGLLSHQVGIVEECKRGGYGRIVSDFNERCFLCILMYMFLLNKNIDRFQVSIFLYVFQPHLPNTA